MARTPSNQQKWFLSRSPSQNPESASAPSNTKGPSSSPSKLSSSSFPGASSARTALKASTPTGGSVPNVSPTEILGDLYVYLEKLYKPLLAVICKHKFIREAHYPVKLSARIRFVRDAYEEGGLLGYNDEVIRQVLVNVKRYFLDKVGMPDVFDEENLQFGREVDDMAGFDVVVGDLDGGDSDNDGGGGGDGDGDEVLDRSFGGTESEEPFADVVDNILERILKDADAVYGSLVKMPMENGKASGRQTPEVYSDSNQSQTRPVNPEEWEKSEGPQKLEKPEKKKRKRKRSCVKESVEMYPKADEPLDGREKGSADPIEGHTVKHEKKRKKKRSHGESLTEVSCETGEPLDDQEEETAEPVESQAKLAKSENKRKRKRSHVEESVEVSRGSDEPQDDREGKPVNPVESQIKPAKHEKKSKRKRSSVEDFLEMLREMQEPLENSADPAETDNEKSQVPSEGESGAAQRRARRRKKNGRNKHKLRKPASSDALTEIKTPKQDHAATEETFTQDF